jgi:hypothetical protein
VAVSKRLRYEILRRDDHTCRYCGGKAPDVALTVDHVTPTALGGSDDPSNLVAACRDCNAGKSSASLSDEKVADIERDALRWSQAMRAAAEIRARERGHRDDYTAEFDRTWRRWTYGGGNEIPRAPGWKASIWRFFELGVDIAELTDAADIACGNSRLQLDGIWRYFCGIVWSRLREQQELASAVVTAWEDENDGT